MCELKVLESKPPKENFNFFFEKTCWLDVAHIYLNGSKPNADNIDELLKEQYKWKDYLFDTLERFNKDNR